MSPNHLYLSLRVLVAIQVLDLCLKPPKSWIYVKHQGQVNALGIINVFGTAVDGSGYAAP